MSMFTSFDNQYGQGAHTGVDLTGGHSGLQQETVVGHTPGSMESALHHDPTIVTHMPDGLGGHNTYYDGKFVHNNHPNIFGGEDVTDQNGHLLRTSIPDGTGLEAHSGSEHHLTGSEQGDVGAVHTPLLVDHSNATEILSYDDPLLHSGNYIAPPFQPTHVGK